MKAKLTIEFDLNDPSELDSYKTFSHAEEMRRAIVEMKEYLRQADKYDSLGGRPVNDNEKELVETIRNAFIEILSDEDILNIT